MTDAPHPADGRQADSGETSARPQPGAAGPAGWFRSADGEAAPLRPHTEPARSAGPAHPPHRQHSGWQLAHKAWQESGVDWELPDDEPAETRPADPAETRPADPAETGPEDELPALPTWTAPGPPGDADELFRAWQGSVREAAAARRWQAGPAPGPGRWRIRAWQAARIAVPAAIVLAVGIAALIMLTGHTSEVLAAGAGSSSRVRGAAAPRGNSSALAGTGTLASVAHGPAGWIAVGSVEIGGATEPAVLTSADGETWQPVAGISALAGPGAQFRGVAAGRAGYVVVGRRTARGRTFAALWWSADLRTWQAGSNGGLDGRLMPSTANAVAATADGFVAVGSHGAFEAIWTSRDGRHWRLRDLRAPWGARSAALRLVVAAGAGGSNVVASGYAVAGAGDIPVIVASADGGGSWHQIVLISRAGSR